MNATNDGMRVELDLVTASPERLRVRYRTGNPWGREVCVTNRLYSRDPAGGLSLDPNRVYIRIGEETLHLAKRFVEVPEGMDVECPEVPFITVLQPGESLTEELDLALPAREAWPYEAFRDGAWREEQQSFERIDFELGYFLPRERSWLTEVESAGQRLVACEYGYVRQVHRSVTSRPLRQRGRCVVTVPAK